MFTLTTVVFLKNVVVIIIIIIIIITMVVHTLLQIPASSTHIRFETIRGRQDADILLSVARVRP